MGTYSRSQYEDNYFEPMKPLEAEDVISTFSQKLRDTFSYNLLENPFAVFGFLWGLPIPLFFIGFHQGITSETVKTIIQDYPIHWFFMAHPFLFAFFFGVLGNVYLKYGKRLKHQATHDDLTNLLTHSVFQNRVRSALREAKSRQASLSLIMLDLDKFTTINDSKGHQYGDQVLMRVARVLLEQSRETDHVGRYGGDEFALALSDTSVTQALGVANRIRCLISRADDELPEELTLSTGIASYPEDGKSVDELINQADKNLYKAKDSGRNRTVLSNRLEEQDHKTAKPINCEA